MKHCIAALCLVTVACLLLAQKSKNPVAKPSKHLEVKRTGGTKAAPSASATYQIFDYKDTMQGGRGQTSGCQCGTNIVTVSPTAVTTKVNTPVQIRYDASTICHKQTIRDLNGTEHPYTDGVDGNSQIGNLTLGTVQWEVGAVSDLPLEWGIITYDTGYAQPTQEQINILVQVQCYDTGPACKNDNHYNVCAARASIPVTVQ